MSEVGSLKGSCPESFGREVLGGFGRPWEALEASGRYLGGPARVWLWEGNAIDVEGHKRRPPSKVGGLCHELRV